LFPFQKVGVCPLSKIIIAVSKMARPKTIILLTISYQNLARRFYKHLLKLGYHPHSSRSRYNYIREFLHWLERKGALEITQITSSQVSAYYDYLSCRPNLNKGTTLSPKTTHSHMRNIRDLFTMLQNEELVKVNPCELLNYPSPRNKSERQVLTQEEIQALYEVAESAQERTILSLAYGCGLRVGELTKCNVEDVKLKDKLLIVPKGKGMKRRVVPMSSGVVKDLADYYYQERQQLTTGRDYQGGLKAFMLHSRGGRMQKWTYNKILKQLIKRTRNYEMINKEISIHHLRHSIATHLIEQGIKLEQVRLFLGHNQLETTQIYTHISQQQLSKLMKDVEQQKDNQKESEIPIERIGKKEDNPKKIPP